MRGIIIVNLENDISGLAVASFPLNHRIAGDIVTWLADVPTSYALDVAEWLAAKMELPVIC
jgi:hypothetical protein